MPAARDSLTQQLRALGFETQTHSSVGFSPTAGDSVSETGVAGAVHSIVARLPGADPTGTLMLATHYDTVPGAPGASDAGIGLASLLETARALTLSQHRNDVVVLITDAEEWGLLGADAFVRERAGTLREPVTVINHEARGTSGRPSLFRTNGPMTPALATMPVPEAESMSDTLFELVPNNTDFTRFKQAGWLGTDSAVIVGGHYYHSPHDDLAHADESSLQHMGEATLAMSTYLADRDLAEQAAQPARVVTTAPWGLLTMPPWAVAPLAGVGLVFALITVGIARRRREVSIARVLGGAIVAAVAIVVAAVVGYGVWQLALMIDPAAASAVIGEPVRPELYSLTEAGVAAAVLVTVWIMCRRRPGHRGLALGGMVLAAVITVATALWSPGFASSMVVPIAAAGVGHCIASVLRSDLAAVIAAALGLTPAAYVLGAAAGSTADLGVSAGSGSVAVLTAFTALLALPLLVTRSRAAETSGPGRAGTVPRRPVGSVTAVVAWLVPAALFGFGLLENSSSRNPVQERVNLTVDADSGSAAWTERPFEAATPERTEWGRELGARQLGVAPGEVAPPQARVIADHSSEGARTLTLQVTSPRGGTEIDLRLHDARVTALAVDGRSAPVAHPDRLRLVGVPRAGMRLELTLADVGPRPALELADSTHDITTAPGYTPPPDDVVVVLPTVTVTTRIPLPTE